MDDHDLGCGPPGCCGPQPVGPQPVGPQPVSVSRRRFLGLSAAAASAAVLAANARAALAAGNLPDRSLVPAGKGRLAAGLYDRGVPASYTGTDLRYIGMPVGGGCCGQVYLGGDGKLWYWDVDNGPPPPGADGGGETYADPRLPFAPFGSGIVLKTTAGGQTEVRSLDSSGFDQVTFTGQYPIGQVDYSASGCPVTVRLEAFSPFIPGEVDDSTLPVTVLVCTITNVSSQPVDAELTGWAENPVCLRSRSAQPIALSSAGISGGRGNTGYRGVEFTAAAEPLPPPRPDILFEDFERDSYPPWTVTGQAFGSGPVLVSEVPPYMLRFGNLNAQGPRFVTSHNFLLANGNAGLADSYTGTLTSQSFTIERRYVAAWVGGGNNPGQTCLNVVVNGAVAGSLTGNDTEPMTLQYLDMIRYQGMTGYIEIVDSATGGWGHVNVSNIVFTDAPASRPPISQLPDGGTAAVAAFTPGAVARPSLADWSTPEAIADSGPGPGSIDGGLGTIAGAVTVPLSLPPGQSGTVRLGHSWFFPVPDRNSLSFLDGISTLQRHYAGQFSSAGQVAGYLASHLGRLEAATRSWVQTWYADSTLPYWFLERTIASASTLATSTCLKFDSGRFYAWEGVDCCPGTCEHVWNYAQAIARLFPPLERDTRQRVDLGVGFHPDTGEIGNRAEADMTWATDGQCGTILRIYREHQMSPDASFLTSVWPRVKQAIGWVMAQDARNDGTLEGPQPNTLDAVWYGEVAWMTGMYDAALYACAEMASEMGDDAFSAQCQALAEAGSASIVNSLWTGEYFIQLTDPNHPEAPNSNIGCHIDQMFGQSLALQLGLPRVFPADKAQAALGSIYQYSFVPDPAAYRAANTAVPGGRWFAMAGEPAMIMCTFPHGGAAEANGSPPTWQASYFNESWTGQEHQLAAHMIYDGLVDDGMTVIQAVHERYDASKRNPYNEIECSEHYARAMAAFGVFLAACGYSYHGPLGRLGFAPKISPDDFAAAFTAAQGWGLYRQRRLPGQQMCSVELRYGQVSVSTFTLELAAPADASRLRVTARQGAGPIRIASTSVNGTQVAVTFSSPAVIQAGHSLEVDVQTTA
jgi:uncharacterized protein (DUF608 family)